MLTQERLKKLLSYSPDTGEFGRLVARGPRSKGAAAGSLSHGYIQIMLDRRVYRAHRLAWLYTHGVWPVRDIDHIDGNKANNQIKNLREATDSENNCNVGLKSNNTTGYKGVHFYKARNRFQAYAKINGKRIHLGYFPTAELASEAYQTFAKANHGEFYRLSTKELT